MARLGIALLTAFIPWVLGYSMAGAAVFFVSAAVVITGGILADEDSRAELTEELQSADQA